MGFIEDYFHKSELTENDIQDFIDHKTKENLTLDYKRIEKFKSDDLSEHVSAFANSAGGLIILGIEEKNELPEKITWGNSKEHQKESLESKLFSTIYPKINGLKIISVSKTSNPLERIFLIDIPQGDNPPYMAWDKRYYKRLNFQKVLMEGYEVADCFGRRKRPKLSMCLDSKHFYLDIDSPFSRIKWNVNLKNVGKSIAREILCKIETEKSLVIETVTARFQTMRDDTGKIYAKGIFIDDVLFPHPVIETELGIIHFKGHIFESCQSDYKISYELLAENMPIVKGGFTLSIITLQDNHNVKIKDEYEEELKE
jgi:hypothetical protein